MHKKRASSRANNRQITMRVAMLGMLTIGIVRVESFAGSGMRILSSKGCPVIWGGNRASNRVRGGTLSVRLGGAGIQIVKTSMSAVESTVKTGQKLDKVSDRLVGGSVRPVIFVVRVIAVVYCWDVTG